MKKYYGMAEIDSLCFFCGRGSPERMFEILVVVKNAGKTILDILVRL
ncbi:hypothetical protein FMM74_021460 [Lachnospiraceae bacterium MD308]|nr:hypothetical protein [Lachnospiraceae bacterium MD308]MCI8580596.1 hypothetical protein [Dorea sp.]